ncbi:TauD/TfdA family dioxygenase [Streptomyces sp. AM 4-1-1]|uniref:TauD/TfdA dioxygenase family protein n=1 Tax=Streptomyces sp. AM 4-1-1 TaxID=3028710 RepID=UPI0023B96702|nr:TauD/TfdA family dioxygenase [Streptomyces sp. AM 4-1-1]WEH34975.1 TauD/TfdA family dioxygenase [Streptomyces sp. AM 4-1-1]
MTLKRITEFVGAEITDVNHYDDLDRPEVFDEFLRALREHELVVVRGFDMTPRQQVELAARIGKPVPFVLQRYRHPEMPEIMISSNEKRDGRPVGVARVGNFWHQDSSFVADPAPYTMLHGVNVPSTTGHTLFASAIDVYDRMPREWRDRIEDRTALHTVAKRLRIREDHIGLSVAELKAWIEEEHPLVERPLVETDPYTGRKFVYGAPEYLDSVTGFDHNENAAFFEMLDGLIQEPSRVYEHRWTTNDLIVWKTRTTLHAATDVTPGVGRTVHRVSIAA